MSTSNISAYFRPNTDLESVGYILLVTAAIAGCEVLIFLDQIGYAIGGYALLLFGLSVVPLIASTELPVFQAFALIPVFRLVNLTMPMFVDLTIYWLPVVYGPVLIAILYVCAESIFKTESSSGVDEEPETAGGVAFGRGLPWWLGGTRGGKLRSLGRSLWTYLRTPNRSESTFEALRHWIPRVLVVSILPFLIVGIAASIVGLSYQLAALEYEIVTPAPLIEGLGVYDLALLAATMIVFVGFVEELIFRGLLQQVLEQHFGIVPGLLFAGGVYALVHASNGLPMEIAFAGGVGLLLGILYDVTDSLILVSVMHGLINVYLFGVIPLGGLTPFEFVAAAI